MAENPLKYTEDELVDLGWEKIKEELPRKKRRPIGLFWYAAAAVLLSSIYVGFFLLPSTSRNLNSSESKVKDEKKVEQHAKPEESENSEMQMKDNSYETESQKLNKQIDNQHLEKATPKLQKQTTKTQERRIYSYKGQDRNELLASSINTKNLPQEIEIKSAKSKPSTTISESEGRKSLQSQKQIEVEEETESVTQKSKKSIEEKIEEKKQVEILIEEAKAPILEQAEQAQTNENVAIETRVAKKPRLQYTVGGELLVNQNPSFGAQVGGGVSYQLSEKQSLMADIQFGIMQDRLESFTVFNEPDSRAGNIGFQDQNTLGADDIGFEDPLQYEAILIEVPIKYAQQVSKKVKLNGGVVANYANFKDFKGASSTSFLVSSQANHSVLQSNFVDSVSYFRLTERFVEQFEQFSVGANVGTSLRLKDNLELDASVSFAFQPLSTKDFMDYKPNFLQIGAKYYLHKRRKE